MKIIIFGSTGMLGNYLCQVLSKKFEVVGLNRKNIDLSKLTKDSTYELMNSLSVKNSIVINASGVIKQRSSDIDDLISVNSLFPNRLAEFSDSLDYKVIHITTDCVFSGKTGNYTELSPHDADDFYGRSKSLGENEKSCNIRTSINGEEIFNKRSLLEWCRSMSKKTINGYTNHYWNGVTCLELSKLIEKMIKNDSIWTGVRHIFSEDISKHDLVKMINDCYKFDITVKKYETEQSCDRTLRSIYDNPINESLITQIEQMKLFSGVKG